MAAKIKRGRGRPSFESSYKQRRKIYNRYLSKWEKSNKRFGGNIAPKLDYKEFKEVYSQYRTDMSNAGRTGTITNFVSEQVLTTKSQASSAASNFNARLDALRDRYANNPTILTPYETDILELFGYNKSDGGITQQDIRGKSAVYKTLYSVTKAYGVGEEAFGS